MRNTFKSLILVAACAGALSGCGGSSSSTDISSQSKALQRSTKAATAADYQTVVEDLYVSYFGRPADPTGLSNFEAALLADNAPTDIQSLNAAYATDTAIQTLVNSFGTSTESTTLYGNSSTSAFVTAVFNNVLNRAPQTSGLDYWVNAIQSGTLSQGDAALAIMAGALANTTTQGLLDTQLINNRIAVAEYFTSEVTSQNKVSAYVGSTSAASARSVISAVTASTNVASYQATVNAAVAALTPPTVNNVTSIVVDSGPDPTNIPAINESFTSVTICAPANPTLCQTIDHVLVDTGSYGLRLMSSVLNSSMKAALSAQSSGSTLVECTTFVDGYTWGPVRKVNFQIAGETANNMPMQVIGDPTFSSLVPSDCSDGGSPENTVDTFGSNGVIGVGLFQQDCGSSCTAGQQVGYYYTCTSSSCSDSTATLAQQVTNPIALFASDNNGVIITLPSIGSTGAASVSGTMTFGVNTQTNNTLSSQKVFGMDSSGNFTTIYNGQTLSGSFIDSGSNGLYFDTNSIAQCGSNNVYAGFYCPSSALSQTATMKGVNSVTESIGFTVANPANAISTATAYTSLAAPIGINGVFDWGLPFFFGRSIYVVMDGDAAGSNTGPFVAF